MKLFGASLFRYRLPLTEPVQLPAQMLTEREGILLRIAGEDGVEGWGEAAPLPGFSYDTLEETTRALRVLVRDVNAGGWHMEAGMLGHPAGGYRLKLPFAASAALDSVLRDLDAAERGKLPPQALTHETLPETIHLAALLDGEPEVVLRKAREAAESGFRAVKLKVGRRLLDDDADLVHQVARVLGPRVFLRLDANRAWSFDEATRFFELIREADVAYVEEPLLAEEILALPDLAAKTGMPIALDETIADPTLADHFWPFHFARALVLKPTILGGVRAAFDKIWKLHKLGVVPVVSSAYESGIGTRGGLVLAAAFAAEFGPIPAGLGTYCRLADDVLTERLPLDGPEISLEEALKPREVDASKLERVEV